MLSRPLPGRFDEGLSRRCFVLSMAAASIGFRARANTIDYPFAAPSEPLLRPSTQLSDIIEQVTPKAGVSTGIAFKDSLQRLIAAGALDIDKLRASEKRLPDWVERLLGAASDDPILFSEATAPYLVNLLWPLGLSNKVAFNENSQINTLGIPGFASTGGWSLGRAPNGYVYFNKVDAIRMTDEQQLAVLRVATSTFRPCCDNSTFFQDCNHGSALLGLVELAASQGATAERLYDLALTANSFWFPEQYAKTAIYFAHFHNASWGEIAPERLLGRDFSTLSGWEKNVNDALQRANIRLPGEVKGQSAC